MKLKSVYIGSYKNINSLTVDFSGDSYLDIFVGRNASGKSNFFEALLIILQNLFEYKKDETFFEFDFKISYEKGQVILDIECINGQVVCNGNNWTDRDWESLPNNILLYYSGHNERVAELIQKYEDSFRSRIKNAGFDESRKFIGLRADYKQLLLAVLFLMDDEAHAKTYLLQKLGIADYSSEIKLHLKRPIYARGKKGFDTESGKDDGGNYLFWSPEGVTKTFLDRLSRCISISERGDRAEGFLSEEDQYILYFNIDKLNEEFNEFSSLDWFKQLDNLKVLDMLDEVSIKLVLENGYSTDSSNFSDGQFQAVFIYTVLEVFKHAECLCLFDEPDAFLHPEWQFEFLKHAYEISGEELNSHVLMSSHSGVTLIPFQNNKIRYFDLKHGCVNQYSLPKKVAIQRLSSNIIEYNEEDSILSILNTIQIEQKPVLFTEGSTDPIIIKTAWEKLYPEDEIPFIPFFAFNCSYLGRLLKDERVLSEMGELPLMGLFDFDRAYDEWSGLGGNIIEDNPNKGMYRKIDNKNSFGFLLPVPQHEDIRRQVVKNEEPLETFAGESFLEMELLFYGNNQEVDLFFESQVCPGGGARIVFKSDGAKTKFAKEEVPKLDSQAFDVFKPLFDSLKSVCHGVVS